jgi:hypothetical protein
MPNLSGVNGACKLNGVTFSVTGWGYSGSITTEEITNVGDTDKQYKQVTRDGSGNMTATFNADDASQKVAVDFLKSGNTPGSILLQLYQDSVNSDQLYFSAVITSIDLPKAPNGVDVLTLNYQKTGPLYLVPTT